MTHWMRRQWPTVVLAVCAAVAVGWRAGPLRGAPPPVAPITQWQVCFSPEGGCTAAIVRELGAAKKSVRVQAYSFTAPKIAEAVVQAKKRGLVVEVILDSSQRTARYSSADFLAHMGVPTFIDARHAIAHNKVMILDETTVITGSFNFTKSAEERNAENLLILRNADLAARYLANWKLHRAHAEAYTGK